MEQLDVESKFVDIIIDEYPSAYARLDDRGELTENGLVKCTVGELSPFADPSHQKQLNISLIRQKAGDVALLSTFMLTSVAASNIVHLGTLIHQAFSSFRTR